MTTEYPKTFHHRDPEIYTVDHVLTSDECQMVKDAAEPHLKVAGVSVMPGQKGYEKGVYKGRTNRSHWIEKLGPFEDIARRIADIVGCDWTHFESLQVIHYTANQEYKYHYDAYDKNDPVKYQRFCGERGNRLQTILVYLNEVEEGGETAFNKIKPLGELLRVKPQTGRMVVFQNVHSDGSLHRGSQHAGQPVIQGEKWAFNLWLRER
jgi:prolyl 4-hydroxylase